jgi:hypothetical protein
MSPHLVFPRLVELSQAISGILIVSTAGYAGIISLVNIPWNRSFRQGIEVFGKVSVVVDSVGIAWARLIHGLPSQATVAKTSVTPNSRKSIPLQLPNSTLLPEHIHFFDGTI